jgi:antitoxin CptB
MSERRDHKIKRLKMRSMRRGIKEMDIILSHFASNRLEDMTLDQLSNYDLFTLENDHDLYAWIMGTAKPPQKFSSLVNEILAHLKILQV